ncbi:3945_t:CDS:2, partial [Cetraspora pellucida]
MMNDSAFIYLKHKTLHQWSERNHVTDKIKNKIKKNLQLAPSDIYKFICDDDQVNSAKMFLEEHNLQVIMFNNSNRVKLLGFITSFFEKFKENKEIFVDAMYKTNALGYELYSVISQYDGSGFAMTYLFVKGNKQDEARTEILADFFKILHNLGMNKLVYLYTDKDFAQILAAWQIWINIK